MNAPFQFTPEAIEDLDTDAIVTVDQPDVYLAPFALIEVANAVEGHAPVLVDEGFAMDVEAADWNAAGRERCGKRRGRWSGSPWPIPRRR